MSSESKAKSFAQKAEENGWTAKVVAHKEIPDHFDVVCHRGDEEITIWWENNSLLETPKYNFGGRSYSLHNAATAARRLSAKPDVRKVIRARRQPRHAAIPASYVPFDIWEAPDEEIMRDVLGSHLSWRNSVSGEIETAYVPKSRNWNTQDVFYLSESKAGKPFLSFMDELGMFRAVHLEAIVHVG